MFKQIKIKELDEEISIGKAEMSTRVLELWNNIVIVPQKWTLVEYGTFWVVAIHQNYLVWYNDIEEGFNISTFSVSYKIDEYGAEQDELQTCVRKLFHLH